MNKKEDYVIKKKWNLKLRVFIGMLILTLINFLIFNDIYFLHDDAEGSFIYCRTIIILEFILILVFISRFRKRYDIYDICLSFLFCFAVLNFIMNKVYSMFFYSYIKSEFYQLQSGKIINKNYIRGGSTITVSVVDNNILIPVKKIGEYTIGTYLVYGLCEKYNYYWIESLNSTHDTYLKYLFPKIYVHNQYNDSITRQYIEKYLQNDGVNLVYKAKITENEPTKSNVLLEFWDCTNSSRNVSYNKSNNFMKRDCDTLLIYENTNNIVGEHVTVCSMNINNFKNRAKISDYGYIWDYDIYSKEEIEDNYPQIKNYVEKFKERNKQ